MCCVLKLQKKAIFLLSQKPISIYLNDSTLITLRILEEREFDQYSTGVSIAYKTGESMGRCAD